MTIDWSDGRVITLTEGDTAELSELNSMQLYGVFLYNTANNDNAVDVTLAWSDNPDEPPVTVSVPGTTASRGPAVIRFVSGDDASYISASVTQDQRGAQVTAFICNVQLPRDGGGLHNQPLPDNGRRQAFTRLTRFYCVPAARWYNTTVQADMTQFISVRFVESFAYVTVVNDIGLPPGRVEGIGEAATMFRVSSTDKPSYESKVEGDGSQQVWVNADSVEDSQHATLSLQPL
jgi:hypothetical protein